uniref:Ig-like domain-containing protein n=1 Tax=Hucho hucho TaxID=62062 RepID=A0A4W5LZ56_9TELE
MLIFIVFLCLFSGVLGQYGWDVTFTRTRICALKGLSVDVSCTYRYPSGHEIIKTEWYKWWNVTVGYTYNIMEQPKYAGRVEYLGNNHSDCTLRITDLRENDTAEYCFGFKTNIQGWIYQQDLFISVTDLKVTTNVTEGSWVILNCSTTCTLSDNPNPDYIWYKNGNPLHECMSQNYSILSSDEDSYSCAVKATPVTSVSVSPSGEIVEGSSVILTCRSDANPPVQKYTWYKRNINTSKASGQIYNISYIRLEDSGEYYCEAQNEKGASNSTVRLIIVSGKQTSSINIAVESQLLLWFSFSYLAFCGSERGLPNQLTQGTQNHEEPLYSTVQQKQDNEVQYAALKFNRLGVAPHPAAHAAEDPSAIYSTVNKPRTRTQEGTFLSSYPTFPRPPTGSLYSY